MTNMAIYQSSLGKITILEKDGWLVRLWIEGQEPDMAFDEECCEKETPILSQTINWLDRYFSSEKPRISELKINPSGGVFRQTVWRLLEQIPYGETVTYGEIAKKVATLLNKDKMSAQAIGGAVGHNPISIIIPCHRVMGAQGKLTGYGGGIDLKINLLKHEGVKVSEFR